MSTSMDAIRQYDRLASQHLAEAIAHSATIGPSLAEIKRAKWDAAATTANAACYTRCHYGTAGCRNQSDDSHECYPAVPFSVRAETEGSGGPGYVDHTVAFSRPVTMAEFRAYVEARASFGYHPAGYGGTARVAGFTGVWRRYGSAD